MRSCWLVLVCAACGGEGDDEEMVDCDKVTGTDTFVVGLEKAGGSGALTFKLLSATPAPPARGNNTWIVQVNKQADQTALDGATIKVTPFMPSHQHGTGVPVEVAPMSGGQYQLSPVNLWMQGVWETTIRATLDTTTDSAVYKFCVE